MPVATAAGDARAARRVTVAAVAVALQGAFYFLILHETVERAVPPGAPPLQVILLQTTVRQRPLRLPRQHERPASSRPSPRRNAVSKAGPQTVEPAPHAPIDWQRGIRAEVREEQSPPRKLDFGFPQAPQAPKALPEFGWDNARIHRVEPLSGGGTLIHLGDHCVLVIYALMPFPGCEIGRIPANGHLFDGLEGPWNDRTNGLP